MARPTAPCCEIRFLVLHTYPDGIKAYGHERITTPIGRRGKPVKKLRLIPAHGRGTPGSLTMPRASGARQVPWITLRQTLRQH